MNELAKEYAVSLFELALETGSEDTYMTALETVSEYFREEDLLPFLSSPAIPLAARLALLDNLAGILPEYPLSFVKLLCEKGRLGLFADCMEEYRRLYRLKRSRATAKVTSALPLTEEEKKALQVKLEKISKCTVEAVYAVDPALLGGVVVELGDKVIDGSLATRLAGVKDVITG